MKRVCAFVLGLLILGNAARSFAQPAANALAIGWTNNLLTISGPNIPGGQLEVWYLEAFCRRGSTRRDWNKTMMDFGLRTGF